MRKTSLILISILFGLTSSAQRLSTEWVVSQGGTKSDRSQSVVHDGIGNIYLVGYFQDTVDFDPSEKQYYLSSSGDRDIFVQKLDSNGELIWVRRIGGLNSDIGFSACTDKEGHLLVCGEFMDSVDFDPGPKSHFVRSKGEKDGFILKLDTEGEFVWVKSFGGVSNDYIGAISTDHRSNIFLAGGFQDTVTVNLGSKFDTLISVGEYDYALQKLDKMGNAISVHSFGGRMSDYCNSISTDREGNLLVTGSFSDSVDFSPTNEVVKKGSNGAQDIFIQKFDTAMKLIWVKVLGGPLPDHGGAIIVDGSDNYLLTGSFHSTVDFNPGPDLHDVTALGYSDVFLLKLNSKGEFQWVRTFGGLRDDKGISVAVDDENNVYSTGVFELDANFHLHDTADRLSSLGGEDVFLYKLDSGGSYIWAKSMGGTSGDWGYSVTVDPGQNVFLTGFFSDTGYFDQNSSTFKTVSNGGDDFFIQRLSQGICGPNSVDVGVSTDDTMLWANTMVGKYQWLDCDDSYKQIKGANHKKFMPTRNGRYAVQITQDCCVDTSNCVSITTIGAKEVTKHLSIEVYPNPISDYLQIRTESPRPLIVTIADIKGNTVLNMRLVNEKGSRVPIHLVSGIYVITIESDNSVFRSKLYVIK